MQIEEQKTGEAGEWGYLFVMSKQDIMAWQIILMKIGFQPCTLRKVCTRIRENSSTANFNLPSSSLVASISVGKRLSRLTQEHIEYCTVFLTLIKLPTSVESCNILLTLLKWMVKSYLQRYKCTHFYFHRMTKLAAKNSRSWHDKLWAFNLCKM